MKSSKVTEKSSGCGEEKRKVREMCVFFFLIWLVCRTLCILTPYGPYIASANYNDW